MAIVDKDIIDSRNSLYNILYPKMSNYDRRDFDRNMTRLIQTRNSEYAKECSSILSNYSKDDDDFPKTYGSKVKRFW